MKSDLHVFFRQHAVTEIMDYFLERIVPVWYNMYITGNEVDTYG